MYIPITKMRRFAASTSADTLRTIGVKQFSNTVWNRLEAGSEAKRLHSYPQVVDIVLTKACNLRCRFCRAYETDGRKSLSTEHFQRAATILFPTARKLSLCSGGEPYLHKRLIDFLRIARQYKLPTWLLSNGTRLTEDISETIVNERLVTWHGFSVDGIHAKTVEAIRSRSNFELIVNNIQKLINIRRQNGSCFPRIVIRYALMRSNIEELPEAIKFWGSRGIDKIDCSYLSVCNGIDPQESLFFHTDLSNRTFHSAKQVCERFPQLSLSLPSPISDTPSPSISVASCHQPWQLIRIDTDGEILPCFHSWRSVKMGNIGSLDRLRFARLWNGRRYQYLRASVNADTVEKFYKHCLNCPERIASDQEAAHFEDEYWINATVSAEKSKGVIKKARKRPH